MKEINLLWLRVKRRTPPRQRLSRYSWATKSSSALKPSQKYDKNELAWPRAYDNAWHRRSTLFAIILANPLPTNSLLQTGGTQAIYGAIAPVRTESQARTAHTQMVSRSVNRGIYGARMMLSRLRALPLVVAGVFTGICTRYMYKHQPASAKGGLLSASFLGFGEADLHDDTCHDSWVLKHINHTMRQVVEERNAEWYDSLPKI